MALQLAAPSARPPRLREAALTGGRPRGSGLSKLLRRAVDEVQWTFKGRAARHGGGRNKPL